MHMIQGLICILIGLCLSLVPGIVRSDNLSKNVVSIVDKQVKKSDLSITSFVFNPINQSTVPSWLDQVLGSSAVFFGVDQVAVENGLPADETAIKQAHKVISSKLTLPESAYNPVCSIELLGYIHIETQWPIAGKSRFQNPMFGHARLIVADRNLTQMECYYRVMFENSRIETFYSAPIYWATVFYCPILDQKLCQHFDRQRENRMVVSFHMSKTWSASFTAVTYPRAPREKSNSDMGICLSIPYTSTDTRKQKPNAAILQEWVKYYLKLGFKVMVYDREGKHSQHIQVIRKFDHKLMDNNLFYYNHTIRQLLDPQGQAYLYDNNEEQGHYQNVVSSLHLNDKMVRAEIQRIDKMLTSTHCRFEMKALLGIEDVIVADFDEFLYCPSVSATAMDQASAVRQAIGTMRQHNVTQIEISQRMVMNKTISTRDCMIDHLNRGLSVLLCYAPYKYIATLHSIKSFHLGHHCPLTGYHQACSSDNGRAFDCLCKSELITDCEFIHLSTKFRHFEDRRFDYLYDEEAKRNMTRETNEIYRILYPG
jgi:hypothetical protein